MLHLPKRKLLKGRPILPNKVDMSRIRKCERLVKGKWKDVPFDKLQRGDIFHLFDPDGTPVDGGEICICLDNPFYTSETKIWGVKSSPYDRHLLLKEFDLPKEVDDVGKKV